MKLLIRKTETSIYMARGVPVTVPELRGIALVATRLTRAIWSITEPQTGRSIGFGRTLKAARQAARDRMKVYMHETALTATQLKCRAHQSIRKYRIQKP